MMAWSMVRRQKNAAFIALYLLVGCSSGRAAQNHAGLLAQQQELIKSLVARVTPAVVAIDFKDRCSSSGVIVSENCLVLTHGHHSLSVLQAKSNVVHNREVPVVLSDGRTVTARLLATHCSDDVEYSLLKITTEGKWPYVEVARGDCPQCGDWCLHLGHPFGYHKGRLPVPRLGQIVAIGTSMIASSCMCVPGDSGGPLFDRKARVIGILTGMLGLRCHRPSHHTNVAILERGPIRLEKSDAKDNRAVRVALIETRPTSRLWRKLAKDACGVTVQVHCDDTPKILGTIVNPEGWVVTKRSELSGELACLLVDGRRVAAQLVAEAQDFDVALLKLDSGPLPDPPWSRERCCVRSTVVASIGMTPDPLAVGIVGDAREQSIPAERGYLCLHVEATKEDLRFGKLEFSELPYARPGLREGDLLVSIEDSRLETLADYSEFWKQHRPTAGDPISLLVQRRGKSLPIRVQCPPAGYDMFRELDEAGELSPRRSGFPVVIVHDSVLNREHCGGPVVDISGKIIGINIARAARHATYTIPTTTVLDLAQRLRPSR